MVISNMQIKSPKHSLNFIIKRFRKWTEGNILCWVFSHKGSWINESQIIHPQIWHNYLWSSDVQICVSHWLFERNT